jgi:glycosyltransferase involved in cell wall biosynthesis
VIAELCRKHDIQLIHANTDSAAVMAWEASRQIKLPFIWHCRDMRAMHGFAKILGGAAAAVVPISATVREHLSREGVRPEKLCLVYNGIDLTRFHQADIRESVCAIVRGQLGIPMNRPVILCVAAYVPWKRIDLFFESLRHLLKKVPGAMGLLVGSDLSGMCADHEQSLERLRHQLGLDDNVLRVLGYRDDVPDLMAASDILVSCSENEPFGRVLVEASAAGLPVVSTNSGAKSEIIEAGVNGVLIPPGDASSIAEACAVLLYDPALRERLSQRARVLAAERFDVKRTASELASLFHTCVPAKKL